MLSVVIPKEARPPSSRPSGRCGVPKPPSPCRGGLTSSPRRAAEPVGRSWSTYGSVSLLIGRFERASIQEAPCFEGSPSLSLPRLPSGAFSFDEFSRSSALALPISPLNLLSPRTFPKPGFFSDWGIPKLPNAPMGPENPPPCEAAHGAVPPGLNGAVVVRLRFPKGPEFSVAPFSFSLSSPMAGSL